jgi:hypothetical protein
MRRPLSLVMSALLISQSLLAQDTGAAARDLKAAIQQVNDGLLDAGIASLETVIRQLPAADGKDLEQAYLYKGIAQVGLSQEEPAKQSFREVLRIDPSFRMRQGDFPDRIVRVFEAARTGKTKSVMERPNPMPKKAGMGAATVVLIGGGVALAGGAAAVAASSGKSSSSTPTPGPTLTLTNARFFSARVECERAARGTSLSETPPGAATLLVDLISSTSTTVSVTGCSVTAQQVSGSETKTDSTCNVEGGPQLSLAAGATTSVKILEGMTLPCQNFSTSTNNVVFWNATLTLATSMGTKTATTTTPLATDDPPLAF